MEELHTNKKIAPERDGACNKGEAEMGGQKDKNEGYGWRTKALPAILVLSVVFVVMLFYASISLADAEPPKIENTLPTGTLYSSAVTISADYTDADGIDTASVVVTLDGGDPLTGCTVTATSVSCDLTALPGTHAVHLEVTDLAANTATADWTFTVTRNYHFAWYDDLFGDNWILAANPTTATDPLEVEMYIAGATMDLTAFGGPSVIPGASMPAKFDGAMDGPVEVTSLTGAKAIISQRTLWPKGGDSLEEVLGIEDEGLSEHYYWPWYDDQTPGYDNWILIANPQDTAIDYTIKIAGNEMETGTLQPGERIFPRFEGIQGGPVDVSATGHFIASQRVLSNGGTAFNEVPGTGAGVIGNHYYWPWYDHASPGAMDWIMVANIRGPTATYDIKIAGVVVDTRSVSMGEIDIATFPGVMGGPVEVVSRTMGSGLVASQRSIWGPSFEEVPGTLPRKLSTEYNWTWYDQQTPGAVNWVLVANPPAGAMPPTDPSITYEIKIGGVLMDSGQLDAGQVRTHMFPGEMGGPVTLTSTGKAVVSQRVLWKGYFNEVLGMSLLEETEEPHEEPH